ncbi:MAG: PKD domain-containing protein [Chloroflexia bacterium]|nr:PKD domain-containing protein [Chloroflexia bacterium]
MHIKRFCFSLLALAGLLLSLLLAAPTGRAQLVESPGGLPGDAAWVVRAYYDDPAMVPAVTAWTEPWEVHADQGYLVLEVNPAQYAWLVEAGWRLEIDESLTAQLHQLNQYLGGQTDSIPGYPCYRTVEETFATAEQIVVDYPDLATWTDIGDSWEKTIPGGLPGYDMMVLRLTNANVPGDKPDFLANCAIHAREYTTAELCTRFAEHLVENYGVDPDVTWLLDYHEVHLLLHTNPDGRKKAEAGASWRKNTDNDDGCGNPNSWGVDLNRNFDYLWGCCGGSSGDACSEIYRGPMAASEPEIFSLQEYARSIFPDQRAGDPNAPAPITATGIWLDIHSYGGLVLWSWGWTANPPPNGAGLQTLGRKMAYFNGYWPEQANSGLYPTDGSTKDFAYGDLGVAGYTVELGTAFFQDCATFENVILPDNLDMMFYAARAVRYSYMLPSGPEALNVSATPGEVVQGEPVQLTATANDTRYNNQNGSEPTQAIAAAEYYIDAPPWVTTTTPVAYPMAAADGSFNETVEDVEAVIDTSALSPGRHMVFVRGQDAAGNWGIVSAAFLDIQPCRPVQILDVLTETAGCVVTFSAELSGTEPYSYSWDFDAYSGSGAPAPTIDFGESGSYPYTLTVTNCGGSGQDSYSGRVTVDCCEGVWGAEFGWTPAEPIVGEVLTFSGAASGTTPIDLAWDLGDGTLATGSPVTHSYALDGDYRVTMTATNACGEQVVTDSLGVCAPVHGAAFSWRPLAPTVPETVTLSAMFSGTAPVQVEWDLGDGQTATGLTVTHAYTAAGAYAIVMTAANACGLEVATGTLVVQLPCEGVHDVSLAYTPTAPFYNQPVVFVASAGGTPPFSYTWDLGDGSMETGMSATHGYTLPGSYTVWLTVTNCAGSAAQAVSQVLQVEAYRIYLPLLFKVVEN